MTKWYDWENHTSQWDSINSHAVCLLWECHSDYCKIILKMVSCRFIYFDNLFEYPCQHVTERKPNDNVCKTCILVCLTRSPRTNLRTRTVCRTGEPRRVLSVRCSFNKDLWELLSLLGGTILVLWFICLRLVRNKRWKGFIRPSKRSPEHAIKF